MIRAAVFDFDGVILESTSVKDRAVSDLFPRATLQQRKRVLGVHRSNPGIERRQRIKLLLARGLGRQPVDGEVDRLLERFSALVHEKILLCPEVPGIRGFLESLKGISCYVVSAAPQNEVREAASARGFSGYFADILGMPPSKPENLAEIGRRENVSMHEVLFTGDKVSDYLAAQKAGALFAGRRTPENPTRFPEKTVVIDDFIGGAEKIRRFFLKSPKESKKPSD